MKKHIFLTTLSVKFMNKLKKIPKFNTEEEEIIFWQEHDSTEYLAWSEAKFAKFPNLKPRITLRHKYK